ncbi:hypothetical protein ELG65_09135 [Rhizobium leguminosarum]|uniref:hypothetical protein n=1 Tax=Rhizobium leguminosarum TaxID=384 RepID=UPI00102F9CA3|nr:hypothetical protein [Rhizobium leguminosarum]TBH58562.1 hypothetical protein ELG65_09135 [Rhizobium leguminosarum]
MQASAYFDNDAYHHAVDKLEAISRTFEPAAPDDLRTRIIEVLGNLGIWPADCLEQQHLTTPRLVDFDDREAA